MTASHHDPRFALHQRQPRANKLDAKQRAICKLDHAYSEALRARVRHPERFAAFIGGASYYIDLEAPCPKCSAMKRRTRDRSCYSCHLSRGGANFERMKAGISPIKQRSRESYLDALAREKAEHAGEYLERQFGEFTLRQFPTGRLMVTFPDGYVTEDLLTYLPREVLALREKHPDFNAALNWAGWC